MSALGAMTRKAGKNNTRPCFVLKCDIRKFFDSIDHAILLAILERRIKDKDAMDLLTNVVDSFSSSLPKMNRERERESTRRANWEPHLTAICECVHE